MTWTPIKKNDDTLLTWENSFPLTWDTALMTWAGLTILIRNIVDFIKNNRPTDNWTKQ